MNLNEDFPGFMLIVVVLEQSYLSFLCETEDFG